MSDWDPRTHHRRDDPSTSAAAARQAAAAARGHKAKVLAVLATGPGTQSSLAAATDLLPHQVNKRLADLSDAGVIEPTGRELLGHAGRLEREWRLADPGSPPSPASGPSPGGIPAQMATSRKRPSPKPTSRVPSNEPTLFDAVPEPERNRSLPPLGQRIPRSRPAGDPVVHEPREPERVGLGGDGDGDRCPGCRVALPDPDHLIDLGQRARLAHQRR